MPILAESGLQFDSGFFWDALFNPKPGFLAGLWRTVYISILAQLAAVVLGLVIALMRRSRRTIWRALAGFYIWIIRGTPLLVQLIIVYNGLAAVGVYSFQDLYVGNVTIAGVLQAAILTLAVNESAYMAEIIRAGIESVAKGQTEAALAGGMTQPQAMRWIILPQALRFIVPPLGNNFNSMMKTTSILSVIGVDELFLNAQAVSSTTFRTFEIFIVAALYYLLLTTVWSVIQSWIETRLNADVGLVKPPSALQRLFGGGRPQVLPGTATAGEAR
ncbi:MAG: ABC transporter, permease protein (cluster 3, basic aa/glutamine/opines) [uncultured Nocardioidaceae bacterium]|uniref:ABC transporter, permease protein (Cluster 3, basic aa/glutamine/opines) n=1 Tax=uncultured Nocardioidaceae bacterium TaxID=253824 RepID=A0A6J4L8H5_9ACTN|nr:MAG: ABC transporter, permease protein (cluster 3, basic aa/glutamine/opines) [uncultured Nocardioidaceae bacterium]